MKPIYLEMKNFGPHEYSTIDFLALNETPIFLIGGDTGSGKSTIFDAMTFALFGKTTSNRDPRLMRSQFANPKDETSVTFYFEEGSQLYKIERMPEQELARKNNKGTRKLKTSANFSIVEKVHGLETTTIASKPADVGKEMMQLLNLNAEQFNKIILLPQNEFAQFLKSTTADKEKVLKQVFGTQIFSNFSKEIEQLYKEVNAKNKLFEEKLNAQYESKIWTSDELSQIKVAAVDKIKLIDTLSFIRTQGYQDLKKQTQIAQENLKQATQSYEEAILQKTLFDNLEKDKSTYNEQIVQKQEEFQQNQEEFANLKWANSLATLFYDIKDLEDKISEQKAVKATHLLEKEELSAQKQVADLNLEELVLQQKTIEQKSKRILEIAGMIPYTKRYIELKKIVEVNLKQLEENQKQQTNNQALITSIQKEKEKKQENLLSNEQLEEQLAEMMQYQLSFKDLIPLFNELANLEKMHEKVKKLSEESEVDFLAAQKELTLAQKIYQEKIITRQGLMIAQLQAELIEGEACKVCGSTHHPAHLQTIIANEQELKKAMSEVDEAQNKKSAAQVNMETGKQKQQEAQEELLRISTQMTNTKQKFEQAYYKFANQANLSQVFDKEAIEAHFDKNIQAIKQQQTTNNKLLETIEELQKNEQEIVNKNRELTIKFAHLKENQEKNQKELAQLEEKYTVIQSVEELKIEQEQLNKEIAVYQETLETAKTQAQMIEQSLSNKQTQLSDVKKVIQQQKTQRLTLKQELHTKLQEPYAKTNEESQLKNWLQDIAEEKMTTISNFISVYTSQRMQLEEQIRGGEALVKNQIYPDLKQLEEEKNEKQEIFTKINEQSVLAKNAAKQAKETSGEIKKINKEQGELGIYLQEVTKLFNAVSGKSNQTKLKLETFVVQRHLQKVLKYANSHFLNLLSNNRYTFELTYAGLTNAKDSGLEISVYDNETGKLRPTNTLSGGETFIAALSIALSLSEIVQNTSRGVQIDALFIDEGFGSLDSQTLQKAMEALEKIGENRMIGVISHVEEMKSTIGQQLLLKKLGDGKSKIEMIMK
ncbi:MAG: SMC family ATPase [Streptococcaceae bacterium]|jgi:exonuclease SbcC|nr:SMC family ATPase [Streptococcaceae bacterium]